MTKAEYIDSLLEPVVHVVSTALRIPQGDVFGRCQYAEAMTARYVAVLLMTERYGHVSGNALDRHLRRTDGFVRYCLATIRTRLEMDKDLLASVDRCRFAMEGWDRAHATIPMPSAGADDSETEPNGPSLSDQAAVIIAAVADYYGVPVEKLKGTNSTRRYVTTRRVAIYLMYKLLTYGNPRNVARLIGNKMKAATVRDAIDHVAGHIETDSSMRVAVERLRTNLEQELWSAGSTRGPASSIHTGM